MTPPQFGIRQYTVVVATEAHAQAIAAKLLAEDEHADHHRPTLNLGLGVWYVPVFTSFFIGELVRIAEAITPNYLIV